MSADELASLELLKKQRAAYKGQLTYFKNQCNTASSLGSYDSLLRRIQLVYEKYSMVQLKIETTDDTPSSDRDTFEEEYGKLEATILNRIHELKKAEDATSSTSFQNESLHDLSSNSCSVGVRLPELKLPSFNGAESEWLAFRDVFVDLIHKKNIDKTVKFVYLISHIRSGSAYNLIENLPVTAENYDVAWKSICDRYNNEVSIQRVHMKAIYEIKPPQGHSAKSLQIFIDNIVKNYNALKSLKVKIEEWDLMLTHHIIQRLDHTSRTEVIKKLKSDKILAFTELVEILRSRSRLLSELQTSSSPQHPSRQSMNMRRFSSTHDRSPALITNFNKCIYCSGDHSLVDCPSFTDQKLSPQMRFRFIKDNRLCTNCLIETHSVRECLSPPCTICSFKHNDILHFKNYQQIRNSNTSSPMKVNASSIHIPSTNLNQQTSDVSHQNDFNTDSSLTSQVSASTLQSSSCNASNVNGLVMIGTALVNATSSSGTQLLCRALLDSGSHLNFITSDACNRLKAKRYPTCKIISGISGKESDIRHKIYLTIKSRVSNYSVDLKFYVLTKITNNLPSITCDFQSSSVPVELCLADPYFYISDRIDLLLGVEIYHQLFTGDHIKLVHELPPFYNTQLGYVVCGKAESGSTKQKLNTSYVVLCSIETLDSQVRQFWELENISLKNTYSVEEKLCEEHYSRNVKRLPCGRYSVALPIKPNIDDLGFSDQFALRQFMSLEKRLNNRVTVYEQYKEFMSEYVSLGHMIGTSNVSDSKMYYLPHHYVLKDTSTTTKLRVVFNASAKTSTHLSLNDCLMVGPTIQQTLFAITLRFRKHIYAFCGDIAKMYRQIRVHDEHQDFQRIWWRDHQSKTMQSFKLCTVTYGMASAPFLATRTLKQLSADEYDKYPLASKVLANDFYVDDVLTGASTLDDALRLKLELIKLLTTGGFELRKFQSNDVALSSESNPKSDISLILGLVWNTSSDHFEMCLDKLSVSTSCSKRNILSEICQLFDPLGFCAPIIVVAKLVMQTLWAIQNIGWDDPIPNKIANNWIRFKSELLELKRIVVPRSVLTTDVQRIELHGFGDASEKAFGCVFYIRVTDSSDCHQVKLLCAKSRVAPLKKQSIPRLELYAALLLAEISSKLLEILEIAFDAVFLWSDSEITLFRIKSEPHKYATFVANRVAKIQEHTASSNWRYVDSSKNPADYVSRGLMPSEFLTASLWWSGPEFLYKNKTEWPKPASHQLDTDLMNLDVRQPSTVVLAQSKGCCQDIFNRFHALPKLLRVVSYMLRFYNFLRNKQHLYSSRHIGPSELNASLKLLIKLAQQNEFAEDIKCLTSNKPLGIRNSLRALTPFVDQDGILRVGGRLRNASISYDNKHQIILSNAHVLSKLIVRHEHWKLLHAGPQALLYSLRSTYWIIGGRNLCRSTVHQCIRCFHARPRTQYQIMGELPSDRVIASPRPFVTVGIDFCGPFVTKPTIRSKLIMSCYVCLFVCFTTKAVHLELVMNLSTESFISCFRRFVARRGICSKIFSDNATNFIGARSELQNLKKLFMSEEFQDKTIHYCTEHNIEWCTIPPRSPHFGGLWESAVKSAKHHMRRVIGKSALTIEEYYTLIAQVEACLNSRPLTAMSSDPNDLHALSPGHFIIGSPLTSLMEPSILDLRTNRLSRFQALQQKFQNFWARWQMEYLAELQHRNKWQRGQQKFQIGSLVLLHDNNASPMNWSLGRIIEIHPGKDGVIRVVTIRTAQSVLKRATNRISVLPIDDDSE